MTFENIIVLGATGSVGKQTVTDIVKLDGSDQGHVHPSRIVGLVNSRGLILDEGGIGSAIDLVNDRDAFSEAVTHPYGDEEMVDVLFSAVNESGLNGSVIFIDVTALKGEGILRVHEQALKDGNRVVTANKNPLALSTTEEFRQLAGFPALYNYSPTVMAGGGAISWLRQAQNINEEIYKIEGMFSGTMGFICSQLDEGKKLSEAVNLAYENGYTEPHPHDDLNGLDVLRKLLILGRTAGFDVSEEDVDLSGLVSNDYFQEDVKAYLDSLPELDGSVETMRQKALTEEKVLRYVAEFENKDGTVKLSVGLKPVLKDSPLGRLAGTDNLVNIEAEKRAPNGHVIQTPGAGIDRTSAEVRASAADQIVGGANVYGVSMI